MLYDLYAPSEQHRADLNEVWEGNGAASKRRFPDELVVRELELMDEPEEEPVGVPCDAPIPRRKKPVSSLVPVATETTIQASTALKTANITST